MGGGITLLAVMSEFYEPLLLIPIHGVVQWFSNSSRAVLSYEHNNWRIFGTYAGGAVIGAAIGSQFVMTVDQNLMKILIGIFILFVTWIPRMIYVGYVAL